MHNRLSLPTWCRPAWPPIHHESILHIRGNSYKRFLHVDVLLCRCLKKMDVIFSRQCLTILKRHSLYRHKHYTRKIDSWVTWRNSQYLSNSQIKTHLPFDPAYRTYYRLIFCSHLRRRAGVDERKYQWVNIFRNRWIYWSWCWHKTNDVIIQTNHLNLSNPVANRHECLSVCDVVHK